MNELGALGQHLSVKPVKALIMGQSSSFPTAIFQSENGFESTVQLYGRIQSTGSEKCAPAESPKMATPIGW